MRSLFIALATAGAAVAQSTTCSVPTLTLPGGPISTITQTYTSTYCPICPTVYTTYTTVYSTLCPTGVAPATYTITQGCPGNGACRTGLPPGFSSTVTTCNVCGPTPVTATLTLPCTSCPQATQTQYYQTVYSTLGSTGLGPATYTVTATCAATPCPAPVSNAPAPGFTTTVQACTTCGASPITATLTVPATATAAPATVAGVATTVATCPGAPNCPAATGMATYTGAASNNNPAYAVVAGVAAIAAYAL